MELLSNLWHGFCTLHCFVICSGWGAGTKYCGTYMTKCDWQSATLLGSLRTHFQI